MREKITQLAAMVLLTDFRGSGRGRGREKSTGSDEGEDFATHSPLGGVTVMLTGAQAQAGRKWNALQCD